MGCSFIFLAVSSLSTLTQAKFCWYSGNHPSLYFISEPPLFIPREPSSYMFPYFIMHINFCSPFVCNISYPSSPGLNIYINKRTIRVFPEHFFFKRNAAFFFFLSIDSNYKHLLNVLFFIASGKATEAPTYVIFHR